MAVLRTDIMVVLNMILDVINAVVIFLLVAMTLFIAKTKKLNKMQSINGTHAQRIKRRYRMTDNEIVKALEQCINDDLDCDGCPLYSKCRMV